MSKDRPSKPVLLVLLIVASVLCFAAVVRPSASADAYSRVDQQATPDSDTTLASDSTTVPPTDVAPTQTVAPEQASPPATTTGSTPASEQPTSSVSETATAAPGQGGVLTPTVALTMTAAETPATTRVPRRLRLTALCSDDPSGYRAWRVSNPNDMEVTFTWAVIGTSQMGQLVAPAGSDVVFQTKAVAGPNTVIIRVNKAPHDIRLGTSKRCATTTPIAPALRRLRLVPLCSDNPRSYRVWQVRNPNNVLMTFAWRVTGSNEQGEGTVPANGTAVFQTKTVAGTNTVMIAVDGVNHASRASISARCLVPRRTARSSATLAESAAKQPEITSTPTPGEGTPGWAYPGGTPARQTVPETPPATDTPTATSTADLTITLTTTSTPEWDHSSLHATGAYSDCFKVYGVVTNTGDPMEGSVTWQLYYAPSGNPKNRHTIATGTVPALGTVASVYNIRAGVHRDGQLHIQD